MSQHPKIMEISGLSSAYNNTDVLEDVNLSIYAHDYLGIIGPNGGGKSTLLKCILGVKEYKGTIRFFDKNGKETSKPKIGYLPQYTKIDNAFPITVEEVIQAGIPCRPLHWRKKKKEQHLVEDTMHKVGVSELAKQSIGELSGGQLQRVLLGRAIVADPDILMLDEPNTYLDKAHEMKLYEILDEINKDCAIILVSHDVGTVLQQVKHVACVERTLHYHASDEIDENWVAKSVACPIEIVGHGDLPHRILGKHSHDKKA